jgi:hypothetical protein
LFWVGSKTGKGSGLSAVEDAEFWHEGGELKGCDGTDAYDGLESLADGLKRGVRPDQRFHFVCEVADCGGQCLNDGAQIGGDGRGTGPLRRLVMAVRSVTRSWRVWAMTRNWSRQTSTGIQRMRFCAVLRRIVRSSARRSHHFCQARRASGRTP